LTRDEFLSEIAKDIDPAKHAGEGWFATEEIPRADDVQGAWLRGETGHEGEYYPGPKRRGGRPKVTP
jgi:hypothetical protein